MWNPFSKSIEVTFLDADDEHLIAQSKVPPSSLPETFAIRTDFTIAGVKWDVVRAQPILRSDFSRSRRLTVWLQKQPPITMVPARDLLFSLPTICDPLPGFEQTLADGSELLMREDDWRQCEWVAIANSHALDQELAAIREVFTRHRVGPGFSEIHVRSDVHQPLAGAVITLDQIRRELGTAGSPMRAIRLKDAPHRVHGSFAFELAPSSWLYGTTDNNRVAVLGLQGQIEPAEVLRRWPHLAPGAVLVDWCRTQVHGAPSAK